MPQSTTGSPGRFAAYAKALAGGVEHYGVGLGVPHHSDDDWAAKLNLMHDLRPEVVSFALGLPTIDECRRLKSADIVPVATVTTVEEAQLALACGAQALVAQGPCAGGHRGTFDPVALVRPRQIDSASHRLNLREGKTE
ncbi:MAG: 2-nitropropane dioxygenase [Mycobacterium sp.]|nr:2-nitropropane dioxygenase [Mycobacterium sp.]